MATGGNRVTNLILTLVLLGAVTTFLLVRADGVRAQEEEDADDQVPYSVYLPAVSGAALVTSTAELEMSGEIFGLLGSIRSATDQPFGHFLVLADGSAFALVGATPQIEEQIEELAMENDVLAKVWGAFQRQIGSGATSMIVAADVMKAAGTPLIRNDSAIAIVDYQVVNLRSGPGTRYPPSAHVVLDQVCSILGRNSDNSWWQVDCGGGSTGWISSRLVTVQGPLQEVPDSSAVMQVASTPTPTPTPTATATPTATPTPDSDRYWQATFYDNARLADVPEVSLQVLNIDFDWQFDSPAESIQNDRFSALFERRFNFTPGAYRFNVEADDGVRVWLDGQLLVDEWHGASGKTYSVSRTLAGHHQIRIEYYESGGLAKIRFWFEFLGDVTTWNVEYYQGTELYGSPEVVQREPRSGNPIDYHWGSASPVSERLPGDYWSARWTGTFDFEGGTYVFCADADDGIRVYINDHMVLERWRDGYSELKNRFVGLGSGDHTVRVEYYDRGGDARLKVWWYRETNQQLSP